MKTITKDIIILAMTACMVVCQTNMISAQTNKAKKTVIQERTVTDFTRIRINGPFKIIITQGNTESLKIKSTSGLIDVIKTKVEKGVLLIYSDVKIQKRRAATIFITFKDLNSLIAVGTVKVVSTNCINSENLGIFTSDEAKLKIKTKVTNMICDIDHEGTAKITGNTENLTIKVDDFGYLDAFKLKSEKCNVNVKKVADAYINVSSYLEADIKDEGNVLYKESSNTKKGEELMVVDKSIDELMVLTQDKAAPVKVTDDDK